MENFEHTPKYPVQTLGKALEILNYIKNNPSSEGISISQISRELGIGKSGVHRLLDTLMAYNFVEKSGDISSTYRLGWGLYRAGNAVPKQHTLSSSSCMPIIERLCRSVGETVNLGIYSNYETIILYQLEPDKMLRTNTQPGEREPLYCTALGKMYLSNLSHEEAVKYFENITPNAMAANTITDSEKFSKELKKTAANGYAVDNEEFVDGMICIAMPIKNFSGKIVYGISVSGPATRMTEKKQQEILPYLKEACSEVSSFLGYNQ